MVIVAPPEGAAVTPVSGADKDDVEAKLQQRARQHGRSSEEDRLSAAFDRAIDEILDGRVLPFDRTAAETAVAIAALQRQIGRSVEIRDVQIAGIAAARKQPSPPAIPVISQIWASPSSILGTLRA
jgi:hypothetical protein